MFHSFTKKVKRKVQGVPQSQTSAKPRLQEEENVLKGQKLTRAKQTKNARAAHRPAPSFPSEVITMLKGMKQHEDKEQGKTSKHKFAITIKNAKV